MLRDELGAEEDPAQLDRIGRARGGRDRTHEGLVRVAHVRIDHVEVPLVDGHVDRFAHCAPGVVQPGREVSELDEVVEVRKGPVPSPMIEIGDKGRTVGRREHGVVAADLHAARGIARVLREFARRRAAYELPRKAGRHMDPPVPSDLRTRPAPQRDRLGVAANLKADLLEQDIGVTLDGLEPHLVFVAGISQRRSRPEPGREHLGGQEFIGRQFAGDVGRRHRSLGAGFLPRLAAARSGPACGRIVLSH